MSFLNENYFIVISDCRFLGHLHANTMDLLDLEIDKISAILIEELQYLHSEIATVISLLYF